MDTSLIEVEYDDTTKKSIIIRNWITMLINRNWIHGNADEFFDYAKNKINEYDVTYIVYNDKRYAFKLIMKKKQSIKKVEDIDDFFEKFKSDYKFIVVLSGTGQKVIKQLEKENTEIFLDTELICNLIDNILIPKHIPLTEEEGEQVLTEYKINRSNMMLIYADDPVARYYCMKPGQVVKIIRPSITAGVETAYRVCVPAKMT